MSNKPLPVLILFGPTASGKTGVLLELFGSAEENKGTKAEVVSADSMQVYKGMDIGTAKPGTEELKRLPHHLLSIYDPSEQFNAGDFIKLADKACFEIAERGRFPVVSGGTGFYLKNFILGLSEAPSCAPEIRLELKSKLKEKGAACLMEELSQVDPVSAKRIHINDKYRLLRALEVYYSSGNPLSSFEMNNGKNREAFRFLIIGISLPREELYRRINLRCEKMFSEGLYEEVKSLYKAGYTPDDPGLRAIGYREFFIKPEDKWLLSEDIDGVKALIAQNSRRYAKRQITLFSKLPNVNWIERGKDDKETAERIRSLI